jgi:hypothetical protein
MNFLAFCESIAEQQQLVDLGIWIPAIISIITLIANIIFYFYIGPQITYRYTRKDKMFEICTEFLNYLSDVVSIDNYNGVPTKIRNYCLKIHMMFIKGNAPEPLSNQMENMFQSVKKRKGIQVDSEISEWEQQFRKDARILRQMLSKYTGFFGKCYQ